jgi:pilus assembly protein CpaB
LSQTLQPTAQVSRTIVVATQPLPFGTPLTEDNITEIQWPVDSVLNGAFATKGELLKEGRRVVLSSIERNEPILPAKITGPGQRATLSTLIDEGMRAVTVRVDDVRGVAGFILPNDRVDVVLTRGEDSREARGFADILLQAVKVLAIDQLASEKTEKPTVARAVTLELSAQQAQKVILAQGVGRLSLILNKAGNNAAEQTTRVTVSDLGPTDGVDAAREEIARLQEELKRSRSGSAAAAIPAAPRDMNKIVNVVRDGNKREQYSVTSEGR